MYLDAQLNFSDAQAITANAASTNYYDAAAIRNLGVGTQLYLVVQCDVAMTDTGSNSTCTVTLESDDNSSFSSATTCQTLPAFAATAAAGTRKVVRLAPDLVNERYLRLYYTMANGDLSAGSFTAYITTDIDAYTSYPDGISIS